MRAAALGPVGAGAVTAAFYNYKHDLVARHVPAVWEKVTPEQALAARVRAVDATLRRLLGEEAVTWPRWRRRPSWPCAPPRAVRAAPARSTRPTRTCPCPTRRTWRSGTPATCCASAAATVALAALMSAGLDGLEALVTHTATGRGLAPRWVFGTRGWNQQEWDAAVARLRERGLTDATGELTEEGTALREGIERETDRLDAAPYARLGAEGVARLTELGTAFARKALGAGAFPADLLAKR
ncbi:hypothetical protein SVIOM342S_09090 [Streptomyces violaceorubidus]